MRLQNWMAVSSVKSDVCKPRIISTPFCTGTGFMKWVLITREAADRSAGLSGGVVAAAIFVMEMEEVLVERMAWGGAMWASWLKMEVLREGISGTASIMKSEVERSSILIVGVRRERVESASAWDILCFDTSLASSLSDEDVRLGISSKAEMLLYLQIACPCPERLVRYPPRSLALGLFGLLRVQCLNPDLLELARGFLEVNHFGPYAYHLSCTDYSQSFHFCCGCHSRTGGQGSSASVVGQARQSLSGTQWQRHTLVDDFSKLQLLLERGETLPCANAGI